MKIVKKIQLKIIIFTAMKNRCMLHGRVFVMSFRCVRGIYHFRALHEEGCYLYNRILNVTTFRGVELVLCCVSMNG